MSKSKVFIIEYKFTTDKTDLETPLDRVKAEFQKSEELSRASLTFDKNEGPGEVTLQVGIPTPASIRMVNLSNPIQNKIKTAVLAAFPEAGPAFEKEKDPFENH